MTDKDWKKFIKKEMEKSIDDVMAEIEADPKMKDVKPPEGMYEELMAKIHEHERQTIYEQLPDEDKELIQLGRVYKKKRRFDKFVVALAAVIVGLWLGSVCIGEDENVINTLTRILVGREQDVADSGKTETIQYFEEETVYEEIEDKYGFSPVKLKYLPENTSFLEATMGTDIQGINIFYGVEDKANIIYIIRPNYREVSFGTDLEDKKLQEYVIEICDVEVKVQEFFIKDSGKNRWSINFVYQDVQYLLRITDMKQEIVDKIVHDLYFVQ